VEPIFTPHQQSLSTSHPSSYSYEVQKAINLVFNPLYKFASFRLDSVFCIQVGRENLDAKWFTVMIQPLRGGGCGEKQPSLKPLSISLETAMEIGKNKGTRGN
jgi:hypothetical protein